MSTQKHFYTSKFILDVPSKCLARCKLCHKPYKYILNLKGNLLKYFQISHPKNVCDHKVERSKQVPSYKHILHKDGSLNRLKESFKNQDKILTCTMKHVESRFQLVSRIALSSKLDI